MPSPTWDLVRVLLVVQRTGTLEGAAQALRIDASTLRRKLHLLEQQVGTPLLVRAGGRVAMAPEHEGLLRSAAQMELAFQDFLQQCTASGESGTLRVSTLDILADILVRQLPSFRREHGNVVVELTTEPHFVDLDRERIDVAIRLARPLRGSEGMRRVATLDFAIYASRDYLDAHRRQPGRPHDLLSLYTYYNRVDHDFMLADEGWHLDPSLSGSVVARVDNYPTLTRMCEHGLGLAMLPRILGDGSERLRRFEGGARGVSVDVWALIRRDAGRLPKTQAFLQFAARAFAAHDPGGRGAPGAARPAPAAPPPPPPRDAG